MLCHEDQIHLKEKKSLVCCLCDFLFLSRLLANETWRASLQLLEHLHGTMTFSRCSFNISCSVHGLVFPN